MQRGSAAVADAEKAAKTKRRMLSNISFIGELFKGGLLTPPIMHFCITTLLDASNITKPDDEKIQLLCKLLMSIGAKLDSKVRRRKAMLVWRVFVCRHRELSPCACRS